MNKLFSYVSGLLLTAAGMQIVFMTVVKAYQDYGWLGAVVVIAIGLPFAFLLVPLLAWWLWPGTQTTVLYVLLTTAAVTSFLAAKTKPA
jgi:hypothetical protein